MDKKSTNEDTETGKETAASDLPATVALTP